tara:strand:+ start:1507 stop:1761 length:255 start_codon:yes stop_codon:yes gene_type:complete
MTLLKHISKNHFAIHCVCGHVGLIPVQALIEKYGEDMHVDTVELKSRCSRCKSKGLFERFMIIYVGHSDEAMRSSHTPIDSKTF